MIFGFFEDNLTSVVGHFWSRSSGWEPLSHTTTSTSNRTSIALMKGLSPRAENRPPKMCLTIALNDITFILNYISTACSDR